MEILAILFGIWLVLVTGYVGLTVLGAYRRKQQTMRQQASIRSGAFSMRAATDQPVLGSLMSEVDMLRLQVETLRSEMSALSGTSRGEKARLRRYNPGQYADLPRPLRRQVREVRNFRHPISV